MQQIKQKERKNGWINGFIGMLIFSGSLPATKAAVGQLQLLQPFFGLGFAAVLLHESVNLLMLLVTIGVIFCVAGSRKYA